MPFFSRLLVQSRKSTNWKLSMIGGTNGLSGPMKSCLHLYCSFHLDLDRKCMNKRPYCWAAVWWAEEVSPRSAPQLQLKFNNQAQIEAQWENFTRISAPSNRPNTYSPQQQGKSRFIFISLCYIALPLRHSLYIFIRKGRLHTISLFLKIHAGSAPSNFECSVSHFRHKASLFLCAIYKDSPAMSSLARIFGHSVVKLARELLGLV